MLLPMCATAAAFYPDTKICILGRQLKIWFQPNSMQNKRGIKLQGVFKAVAVTRTFFDPIFYVIKYTSRFSRNIY